MGPKVYNNLPRFIKEIDDYKGFKKELELFFLHHSFYSVEELVSSQRLTYDIYLILSIQNINSQFMNYLLNTV